MKTEKEKKQEKREEIKKERKKEKEEKSGKPRHREPENINRNGKVKLTLCKVRRDAKETEA